MLQGISTRWKQAVAYHFTDAYTSGENLSHVVKDILFQSEKIGLNVVVLLTWKVQISRCGKLLV